MTIGDYGTFNILLLMALFGSSNAWVNNTWDDQNLDDIEL